MSLSFPNLVLPSAGLGWNFARRSKYSTIVQTPQSMRRPAPATLQKGVIYELELSFNGLANVGSTYSDDAAYIQEFYEACRGGYGYFTFDPSQYDLANMSLVSDTTKLSNGFFAIADGVTTAFPLWRSTSALGGGLVTYCEMIQLVTAMTGVYSNGALVPSANYTLTNFPSVVTFTTPPANGQVLTWAGSYAYLCKFAEDVLDMNELLYQLWELGSLKLQTVNL